MTRADVTPAEEHAARLICRSPKLPADARPDDNCLYLGDNYGKPFWMRHVDVARTIMALGRAPNAERSRLADLIKERFVGVAPDSQEWVLEDHDWAMIIAALQGDAS